jgi:hypothetical protein
MKTATDPQKQSLEAEWLRCLGQGTDTRRLDDAIAQLFHLAGEWGTISCSFAGGNMVRLESAERLIHELEVPRAKTKMRMLCARLGVQCGQWAGQTVSLYGDEIAFQNPDTQRPYKVIFQNSPARQHITIESANRAN